MEQKDRHLDILKDEQTSTHDEDMRKSDDERKEEPFTPEHRKEVLKRYKAANCVEIVDLAKSPKKRKQDVGMNPYSRNWLCLANIHSLEDSDKGERSRYSNWQTLC